MTTDIFIKTCEKDKDFLVYCLRSIKKFAHGYRDIVLVVDDPFTFVKISEEYNCRCFIETLPRKVNLEGYPFDSFTKKQSLGYQWQMAIKMQWNKFTNADCVFVVDSDYFFVKDFHVNDFYHDGKLQWFYRTWEEAEDGIKWKSGVDIFLGKDTSFDYMCTPGFVLTRNVTTKFNEFMLKKHSLTIEQYVLRSDRGYFSEFVCIGAFIHENPQLKDYVFRNINEFENKCPYPFIKQYWSWGGLTDEIKLKMEEILNQ